MSGNAPIGDASLGGIAGIIGNSVGEAAAFAAGVAVAPVLAPVLQALRNTTWSEYPDVPLDPHDLAAMVAETLLDLKTASPEANMSGLADTPFSKLVDLSYTAPGEGTLLRLIQRNPELTKANQANIDFGLAKARLDSQWWAAVKNLANERISATDLAYMIVRGVLPDDGLLGMSLPTAPDNLKLPNQLTIDPVFEASLGGWDSTRLAAMVARSGLAMAPVMAANANFRTRASIAYDAGTALPGLPSLGFSTLMTDNDYLLTIGRGDLFPAYATPVREASRAILSPGEYMELALRGWIPKATAKILAAQHGMIDGNAELLYQLKRRPLSPHQIKQALARGGTFDTTNAPFADPYLSSVHEANLGPEWYDLAISLQGSYPSLFITDKLVTTNVIDAATGKDWLTKSGLADEVVTAMDASWSGTSTTTADKNVTSAQTHVKTTVHKSYLAYEISDQTATTALEAAGVAAASVPAILSLYQTERDLIRKSLTAANIKKAVTDGVTNPATGAAWTHADAIAALLQLGYSNDDATTYLEL